MEQKRCEKNLLYFPSGVLRWSHVVQASFNLQVLGLHMWATTFSLPLALEWIWTCREVIIEENYLIFYEL